MTKVLLTGGSGFIAAHCLDQLLEGGHTVVTTVRSEEKAQKIRDVHKDKGDRLQVVVIPDLVKEDAFDEVIKTSGLEVVMHTASPFHFNFTDPQKEIIDPALIGTTSLLKAVKNSAPSVRRVIVTSSFAAIMDEGKLEDSSHVFSEKSWNPVTVKDIHRSKPTAYRASKTLAEKTAWDFVKNEKPNFDLVTVNPPLVVGPVEHHVATLESMNTSNSGFSSLVQGQMKDKEEYPQAQTFYWVDVRDVAKAHVLAVDKKEMGGHRLFTTPGEYSYPEVAEIIRTNFPEYADRLPPKDTKGGKAKSPRFTIDNNETNELLGFKYGTLEKAIVDLVNSLKKFGI